MAKAMYIGVNGVARKVKTPYIGVDSKARKVKKGYIGVNGVARQFYQSETPLGECAVGSTIKLNVNGTLTDFIIVHNGRPSTKYDSSCNGIWLLMKDIYGKRVWGNADNDYANSSIHSYLNSTFLSLFDSNIQSIIKQVKIPYHKGKGNSGSIASGSNGLSTKIFLLSAYEVGYTTANGGYIPVDGACLNYFKGTDETDSKRIGYYKGVATQWWYRSPATHNATHIWLALTDGGLNGYKYNNSNGVRPALILPSDVLVSDDGQIIGVE